MIKTRNLVGIVIPTMGNRIEYLKKCVASVRLASSGIVHLCVVGPDNPELRSLLTDIGVDQFVADTKEGLAAAISKGVNELPEGLEFCNWIGDDDLLRVGSIDTAIDLLRRHPNAPYVFGACDYVDENDFVLFTNRSGRWAVPLMKFGPQLVSQPGALVRRSSLLSIGGLDTSLQWAFDLDMFLRLAKLGRPEYVRTVLAAFRWHDDSLSVGSRQGSVAEASRVRQDHLPRWLRPLSVAWEPLLRWSILRAGAYVTRKYVHRNVSVD
jgi:GT2 family glycosyltransferase